MTNVLSAYSLIDTRLKSIIMQEENITVAMVTDFEFVFDLCKTPN